MFQIETLGVIEGGLSSPRREAQSLFDEMRLQGWLRRLRARLSRRPRRLLSLRDMAGTYAITNRHDAGNQTVPLCQIRGSENRADDFDADFCPRSDRTVSRWRSIAEAHLNGVCLPPVELIQVGDMYFVRDGHHRVSVARALGQTHIEAVVMVWDVDCHPTATDGIALNSQMLTA